MPNDFPNAIEMEKQLLSAMLLHEGRVVPKVAAILDSDDFFRPEHKLVFNAILRLYFKGVPIDYLAVEEELRRSDDFKKIDHKYLLSLIDVAYSTALAEHHAKIIKEKADLRRLILTSKIIGEDARNAFLSPSDIIAKAQLRFEQISRHLTPSSKAFFSDFFARDFQTEIDSLKNYADRRSGFRNLDQHQFFSPGLYVIGATPAAGKTTFCWQLLEQLARQGETCIYCSYEMSKLELFSKSLAREVFKQDNHAPTAAQIRRGAFNRPLLDLLPVFVNLKLKFSVLELQDETIDDLLALLKPLCSDKSKAPVICLDYLQIVPSAKETAKRGVDESVRKLKKFQRDTNTTFIVISSFNRDNYIRSVSFESFKESGNIEYTADVVWALQLYALNSINPGNIADSRKRIDEAKKLQPRQIQLKCLKNRQGSNYDCFFNYHSAHDYFEPCDKFNAPSAFPQIKEPIKEV